MQEKVKGNVKDSIFCNLFRIKKYLLQLYQALHPEDASMTEEGLENVTINHVFTNGIYNDLCFTARGRLILMLEAQSTWSVNVIIRMFIYLAQTYHEYFKGNCINLYGSKKAVMPEPELYVVYTGDRKKRQEYISLSEEYFGGKNTNIELKAKVIYGGKGNDILEQYIKFTKVYNGQVKEHGRTKEAVIETIRICKNENLLKEYLESREKEVVGIMMALFDQEEVFDTYVKSERREAAKEAERRTRKETAVKTAVKFLKAGKCSVDEIRDIIPELEDDDITKIEKEFMQQM
ncbi:MAG: hypothetical protein HFH68_15560 [Lachnospiraceae bacterium]|nr:hypothetical protein [Lachnospiraceae bacterium]